MKYAYYPGCSLKSTAKEFDESARAVCQQLDVQLEEIDGWVCCGASSGHSLDRWVSLALPARNMAIAEKNGLDVAVCCAACFLRLMHTRHEVQADEKVRANVEELIGMPYQAKQRVRHLLDIIGNEVGMEALQAKVKRPLSGLKVASYYGCYLVRPPKVTHLDDPENPVLMDNIMKALGAEPVDWAGKVDCCGGSLSLTTRKVVTRLVGDIGESARAAGADVIATACPLCQANLDSRQASNGLPVLYFTELIGLALGLPGVGKWLGKHLIDPTQSLKAIA